MSEAIEHPALKVELNLMTRQAQQLFPSLGTHLGSMFFMMEVVYFQHKELRPILTKSIGAISQRLDQLDNEMRQRLAELDKSLTYDKDRLTTGPKKRVILHCTTPQSNRSAQLLIHFDQLVLALEQLWLLGILTRSEAMNAIHQWKRKVTRTQDDCVKIYRELRAEITQIRQLHHKK